MKRKTISKFILVGLCVFALAGCGKQVTDVPQTPAQTTNENSSSNTAGNTDEMLDSATLSGSVLDFTDNSCSVSPGELIDNGAGMKSSADGYENEDTAVTVNYNSDCTFVIATLNGKTNSNTSRLTNFRTYRASNTRWQRYFRANTEICLSWAIPTRPFIPGAART